MASVNKRRWTHNGVEREAWVVRYVDDHGKHRSKQFDKKKDAEAYRTKVGMEMLEGRHIADGATLTLEKAIDAYLDNLTVRLQSGQIGRTHHKHVTHYLRKHTPHWLKIMLVTKVKWRDIERLNSELVNASGLKPTTVKKYLVMLGSVFDLAERKEQVRGNPVGEFQKSNRGVKKLPIRAFTVEEVTQLLETAGTREFHGRHRMQKMLQIYVHLAAFCGLRRGEIRALKWEYLDLVRGVVKVRHNLTDFDELKEPKTKAGIRDVPMPRHLVPMFQDWRENGCMEDHRGLILCAANGYGPNGSKITVGAWNHGNFNSAWHRLLKRAGLDTPDEHGRTFRFHALRHFAASMMIERGIPLPEVAALLGHSHFDTTLQIYAHQVTRGGFRRDAIDEIATIALPAAKVIEHSVAQEVRNAA